MTIYDVIKILDKARQLAIVASDWNLDEVEIDGEMVSTYDLMNDFEAAYVYLEDEVSKE